MTRTSVGAHCGDPTFASGFDCAATCQASLLDQCAAPPPPPPFASPTPPPLDPQSEACAAHAPCNPHGDAACGCCELELNTQTILASSPLPTAQLVIFVLGQVLTCLAIAALLYHLAGFRARAEGPVLSASTFSVLLRGKNLQDATVAAWAAQFGPAAVSRVVPSCGAALRLGTRVARLRARLDESGRRQGLFCRLDPRAWLFRLGALGGARHRTLARDLELAERRLALRSQPRLVLRPTRAALVTFESAASAEAAIVLCGGIDVRWAWLRALKRLIVPQPELGRKKPTAAMLAASPFSAGAEAAGVGAGDRVSVDGLPPQATVSRGISHTTVTTQLPLPHPGRQRRTVGGHTIVAKRAPQPSDILWRHLAADRRPAALLCRRAVSLAASGAIVAAGAGAQYGLALLAETARKRRVSSFYLDPSLANGLDWSSWDAFAGSVSESVRLSLVSLAAGLAVPVINLLMTAVVRWLTLYERWSTQSATHRWLVLRLATAYCFNAFAVPVLASSAAGTRSSWYSRGGLVESAFWTQLANAVVLPLASLLDPAPLLRMGLLSRWARTQALADALLDPPAFPLAEQAASAVAVLALALWWGPVLPVSPALGALGLVTLYWADKRVALRRCAAPANSTGAIDHATGSLLRVLPLIQLLLMRYLFFAVSGRGDECGGK